MEDQGLEKVYQRIKVKNFIKDTAVFQKIPYFELALTVQDLENKALSSILEPFSSQIKSIHAPFYDLNLSAKDPYILKYSQSVLLNCIDFAAYFKVPQMVFHTGINPLQIKSKRIESYPRLKESIKIILNKALKRDVTLLIENTYEQDFFYFEKLFEDFKPLKMVLDIGHAHCFSKKSVLQWQEAFQDRIQHYHLHDNNLNEDHHFNLGEGKIDFQKIFPTLNKKASFTFETKVSSYIINTNELKKYL